MSRTAKGAFAISNTTAITSWLAPARRQLGKVPITSLLPLFFMPLFLRDEYISTDFTVTPIRRHSSLHIRAAAAWPPGDLVADGDR